MEVEQVQESLVLSAYDVRRVLDSLVHRAMLLHMAKRGIHPSVIRTLISLYLRLKVRIKITNPFTLQVFNSSNLTRASRKRLFSVNTGALQGSITSPTLFNNGVIDAQSKCISSCIEAATKVTLVCYADDVLNLTKSLQCIEENFSILDKNILNRGWNLTLRNLRIFYLIRVIHSCRSWDVF
jgi:hypothetical protein